MIFIFFVFCFAIYNHLMVSKAFFLFNPLILAHYSVKVNVCSFMKIRNYKNDQFVSMNKFCS